MSTPSGSWARPSILYRAEAEVGARSEGAYGPERADRGGGPGVVPGCRAFVRAAGGQGGAATSGRGRCRAIPGGGGRRRRLRLWWTPQAGAGSSERRPPRHLDVAQQAVVDRQQLRSATWPLTGPPACGWSTHRAWRPRARLVSRCRYRRRSAYVPGRPGDLGRADRRTSGAAPRLQPARGVASHLGGRRPPRAFSWSRRPPTPRRCRSFAHVGTRLRIGPSRRNGPGATRVARAVRSSSPPRSPGFGSGRYTRAARDADYLARVGQEWGHLWSGGA